jgi:nicotinamidase/pyrazinamidase
MSADIRLLVIDPQNDFCDLPVEVLPPGLAPSLPVPGAHQDMLRLAKVITTLGPRLTEVSMTLDSHYRLDIAHPTFWQRGDGGDVAPFTQVTSTDVRTGIITPRDPTALPRALRYLEQLERRGRYRLMVWPVHCEIGTWGHEVHAAVTDAVTQWEAASGRAATQWRKGSNAWTEHYSAILAEVPDPTDASTQANLALVDWAAEADVLLIAGEAGSHCVRATTEHMLDYLTTDRAQRLVLLTDCMSPVNGFEAAQAGFLTAMQARGVRLVDSDGLESLLHAMTNTTGDQHGV